MDCPHPGCAQPLAWHCRCMMSHAKCFAGHESHVCRVHARRVPGPADHTREMWCTCPQDKPCHTPPPQT